LFLFQVLFALVPPPSILGGWVTFIVSLVGIGVMTAIIGDLASIFGCMVGLPDTVTGIVEIKIPVTRHADFFMH